MKEIEKGFDQFYTQDTIAEACFLRMLEVLRENVWQSGNDEIFLLEPSAGDGAFLRAFSKYGYENYYACDIDPHAAQVKRHDFVSDDLSGELTHKNIITVGNPPFGKRARLAADFINTALKYSDTIAFVLPLQFQKYSAQNKLDKRLNLVYDEKLPPESFIFEGKPYSVRCCFQVWTTRKVKRDLRLREAPVVAHRDFEMWQYNNTREAEKYFNKSLYNWDFAVPRQGFKDYTLKEEDPEKMSRKTQWIFFKANSEEVLERLKKMDFDELSKKNTSIPGFGKADVVQEYNMLYSI